MSEGGSVRGCTVTVTAGPRTVRREDARGGEGAAAQRSRLDRGLIGQSKRHSTRENTHSDDIVQKKKKLRFLCGQAWQKPPQSDQET